MSGDSPPADRRRVLFLAGGDRLALPLSAVREVVVPQPPFARVPRAAPAVRGAMNLRGRVVAVVELAPLLGLPADDLEDGQGHVLVLDRDRLALGLLVAKVLGVEGIDPPQPGARFPGCEEPLPGAEPAPAASGPPSRLLELEALEARAASLVQGASWGSTA